MKRNNNPKLSEIDRLLGLTNEARRLSWRTNKNIMKLAGLAWKGAQDAAAELHSTAAHSVELLTSLCIERPQDFKGIAREKFSWPVMYDPHPESMRVTAQFLRDMELGRNTQINLSSGKTFSTRVPANVVALNLHELAKKLRRAPMDSWTNRDLHPIAACGIGRNSANQHFYNAKYEKQLKALEAWGQRGAGRLLPPLSKQTAGQWAKAGKELFMIAYPGDFEEHPYLQELRTSVLGRAKNAYGDVRRGNIRKAMLQALKQAWRSVAALD